MVLLARTRASAMDVAKVVTRSMKWASHAESSPISEIRQNPASVWNQFSIELSFNSERLKPTADTALGHTGKSGPSSLLSL